MSRASFELSSFEKHVSVRYQLLNSLFLTLPYDDLIPIATGLPKFAESCEARLRNGETPTQIVEDFLSEMMPQGDWKKKNKALFKLLQLVERQVVLFDAVEETSFCDLNDLTGAGTVDHLLAMVDANDNHEELTKLLDEYRVRIVLTAHPTQFYPDAVLGIINDLRKAIQANDFQEIRNLLLQLAQTRFKNPEKPTPLKEAMGIIWYLKNVFYKTYPEIQKKFHHFASDDSELERAGLLELGFWPGGDRDGNPFVVAETSVSVAKELKSALLGLYLNDIRNLKRRMTFNIIHPKLQSMQDKLTATIREAFGSNQTDIYSNPQQIIDDLKEIRELIIARHGGLYLEQLDDTIRKVRIFGFHFASMDIRQDSRIHETAISEILKSFAEDNAEMAKVLKGYDKLSDEEKIGLLCELVKVPMPEGLEKRNYPSELTAETLKSLQAFRSIQKTNGEAGLHRYIISNTQTALDLFEVMALAHLSGWNASELTFDVVPLFETIDDLESCDHIMNFLFTHPFYRAHLERRQMRQTIMVGFSDGTKDGGYITANWGIHKAKKKLTAVCRSHGVSVTFFDGRGGPPARGGGNTHKFYRSLDASIERERLQLTIQGQTISANYGYNEAALYNSEQLFTAGLESLLFQKDQADLTESQVQILDELAQTSLDKYLVLKNSDAFTDYLDQMTPLRYYDRLNIGSRPTKRKKTDKLKLEDLRAIPFVGSWAQVKLNIPGFYGLGSALEPMVKNGKLSTLQEMYKESLFFRTLIENAMMSMSKTNLDLTQYQKEDPQFGDFWKDIQNEAALAREMLLAVSGEKELLGHQHIIRESIQTREAIVLPLLIIQQYALEMVRRAELGKSDLSEEQVEVFRKMVVKSLMANINASRNAA